MHESSAILFSPKISLYLIILVYDEFYYKYVKWGYFHYTDAMLTSRNTKFKYQTRTISVKFSARVKWFTYVVFHFVVVIYAEDVCNIIPQL